MPENSWLPHPTWQFFLVFFYLWTLFLNMHMARSDPFGSLFLKRFLAFFGRCHRLVLPPRSVRAVPLLPPVNFEHCCQTVAGSAIWSLLDNTRGRVLVVADAVDTFDKHCYFQVSVGPRRVSRTHSHVILKCSKLQCNVLCVCVCFFLDIVGHFLHPGCPAPRHCPVHIKVSPDSYLRLFSKHPLEISEMRNDNYDVMHWIIIQCITSQRILWMYIYIYISLGVCFCSCTVPVTCVHFTPVPQFR